MFEPSIHPGEIVHDLLELSRQLLAISDLDGRLVAILQALVRFVPCDTAAVHVAQGEFLCVRAGVGRVADFVGECPIRKDQDFVWQYLERTQLPYLSADVQQESWQPLAGFAGIRSFVAVPLVVQDHLIGMLTADHHEPGQYGQEQVEMACLLANHAAAQLAGESGGEPVRQNEGAPSRFDETAILADLGERLVRTLAPLDELLHLVLDQVLSILAQQAGGHPVRGAILLRHSPNDTLRLAAHANLSEEQANSLRRHPVSLSHLGGPPRVLANEWREGNRVEAGHQVLPSQLAALDLSTLLTIPLTVDGDEIGLIVVSCVGTDPATRRLLGAIADLAAPAIQKARLLVQAHEQAAELRAAHEARNQVDRMRNELLQGLAHDLKAPLTFIRGYAELMLEGAIGAINEEQSEALAVIRDRADAMDRLIAEIVQVQQVGSHLLKRKPFALETVARQAVRGAEVSAHRAGLAIELVLEAEQMIVHGDADGLGQVFDNLLSNAIKYTAAGGRISVRLAQRQARVAVSVADTGIGIPAEELDRIWEPYYRVPGTAQAYSGTGLGLANVRRIIEAHSGRIWAQSDGAGTIFTFELPLFQGNE